ncbi:MAG: hypothetical protein ACRENE_23805 [Polyangiaceae bacterium]
MTCLAFVAVACANGGGGGDGFSAIPDAASESASSQDGQPEDGASEAEDGAADAAVCDRHLPTCPTSPPSFKNDVEPLFMGLCAPCHYAGSTIARTSLTTYTQIYADRGSVLNEVYSCRMPPPPPMIPPAERSTILTWLECGAPNN